MRKEIERHEEDLERIFGIMRSTQLPGIEMVENAVNQIRAIRRGSDQNAITTFNAGHRSIKDAIQRGADLARVLTDPQ